METATRLVAPDPALGEDAATVVRLLAERGYALPADRIGDLLPRGPIAAERVLAAARARDDILVHGGWLAPRGGEALVAASAARQRRHEESADAALALAGAYARDLVRHAPWIRVALLSGSLASGGFEPEDDIDVSLVAEDGAKHLAYVAALAVAFPHAWRHRRRRVGRAAWLPFVPKLVCVNVVWTMGEARPFRRRDRALMIELLLSRPLVGSETWASLMSDDRALAREYPQLALREPRGETAAPPLSRLGRFLRFATRGARRRRALDNACYLVTCALHAAVRFARRRAPEVQAHVDRLEATKHPYAILDRPEARP